VNLLDLAVIALAIVAAVGGYRLGFVTRVISWVGMGVGLFVAVRLLPALLDKLRGADSNIVLLAALSLIFGCAFLGQAIGMVIGNRLRPVDRDGTVTRFDGALGALAGTVGVVLLLWLVLPFLTDTPGWPAEQAHRSTLAQNLDEHLPPAPDSIQALRSLIGEDNFPKVFDALRPTPDLGPPPADSGLPAPVAARVARSVVKVEGIACNQVQDGTGFVVDTDEVVTNAHVVAGERTTEVIRDDGSRAKARVVAFDPNRDLALLVVPGLNRDPLPLGESTVDANGGVFGHPGGGPLRVAPFQVARTITAVGRDIYGTSVTRREVLELKAQLRPGDSGSALVDTDGTVVGVAFAIAPDKPEVAYALNTSELRPLLSTDRRQGADTGPCAGDA
jgi:uncharacterized membrane protein required for colicin V production